MDGTFGAILGIAFIAYIVVCAALVPLWAIQHQIDASECAKQHDTFRCVVTWVPVEEAQ